MLEHKLAGDTIIQGKIDVKLRGIRRSFGVVVICGDCGRQRPDGQGDRPGGDFGGIFCCHGFGNFHDAHKNKIGIQQNTQDQNGKKLDIFQGISPRFGGGWAFSLTFGNMPGKTYIFLWQNIVLMR